MKEGRGNLALQHTSYRYAHNRLVLWKCYDRPGAIINSLPCLIAMRSLAVLRNGKQRNCSPSRMLIIAARSVITLPQHQRLWA